MLERHRPSITAGISAYVGWKAHMKSIAANLDETAVREMGFHETGGSGDSDDDSDGTA